MKAKARKVFKFIKRNEFFIISIIAILVVGISAFSFGLIKGAKLNKVPVRISNNVSEDVICKKVELFKNNSKTFEINKDQNNTCKYVGSINGKKFYPPTCPSVRKINPKNLTCFESEEDAFKKGYTRAKSCSY